MKISHAIIGIFISTAICLTVIYVVNNRQQTKAKEVVKKPAIYDPNFVQLKEYDTAYRNTGIALTTIDSCQYVIITSVHKIALVHHENCRNLKHKK